ncbi:type II secretion system F family protein [Devriesea agamarum]|uniref:type II secretion system F family protein n=1 Tax=Devriesea agamarum TaxID=472569 RepID=UPI00071D7820|nr:type II secretion system F family protein [Devriesea agamarum]
MTLFDALLIGVPALLAILMLRSTRPRPADRKPNPTQRSAPIPKRPVETGALAQLAEALAAMLNAGLGPAQAWQVLAEELTDPRLTYLARAAASSLDPQNVVAHAQLGSPGRALAASLTLSHHCGVGLAPLLRELASTLRDLDDADRARRTALAGPRATARLLLALPWAALGIGAVLGGNPITVLLSTPLGLICLTIGTVLSIAGWWWMRRLVDAARIEEPHRRGERKSS